LLISKWLSYSKQLNIKVPVKKSESVDYGDELEYLSRLAYFMKSNYNYADPVFCAFTTMDEIKEKALSEKTAEVDYDVILFGPTKRILTDKKLAEKIGIVMSKSFGIEINYKRASKRNEQNQKPYGFPNLVAKKRRLEGSLDLETIPNGLASYVVSLSRKEEPKLATGAKEERKETPAGTGEGKWIFDQEAQALLCHRGFNSRGGFEN
jgi:hypothetical protein